MELCVPQLVAQVQQVPDHGVVQDGDVKDAARARKHPAHTGDVYCLVHRVGAAAAKAQAPADADGEDEARSEDVLIR